MQFSCNIVNCDRVQKVIFYKWQSFEMVSFSLAITTKHFKVVILYNSVEISTSLNNINIGITKIAYKN